MTQNKEGSAEVSPSDSVYRFEEQFIRIFHKKDLKELNASGHTPDDYNFERMKPAWLSDRFVQLEPLTMYYYYGNLEEAKRELEALGVAEATNPKRRKKKDPLSLPEETIRPEDYYFGILDNVHGDESAPVVVFATKEYWESTKAVPDWCFPLSKHLPSGFVEEQEHFVCIPYHSVQRAIADLKQRGFVYHRPIEEEFNLFERNWDW